MRSAPPLVCLLAFGLLLSGCSGGSGNSDPSDDEATSASSTTTTGDDVATNPPSSGPGSIAVDFTRATPDGAIPLTVELRIAAAFRDESGKTVAAPTDASWSIEATPSGSPSPASGSGVPASATFTATAAASYTLTATVRATGFIDGSQAMTIVAKAQVPAPPIFADGAETDASQWTIERHYRVVVLGMCTSTPADAVLCKTLADQEATPPNGAPQQAYPAATWSQVTDEKHAGAKAWYPEYADNVRLTMTSVPFTVPTGGATASFWVKGGAENNTVDGLFVSSVAGTTATPLKYITDEIPAWKQYSVSLPAGAQKLQFRFDSDVSCSNETPPAGTGGSSACAPGWDGGGIWLDDILVVAK